jgi:hypothetical protein
VDHETGTRTNSIDRKSRTNCAARGRLEEFIELSLESLLRTWNIYENGSLALKQTVLGSAFSGDIAES